MSFEYRHLAYNLRTGEIINCTHGNQLKRAVTYRAADETKGPWRFCHDFGKKWEKGFPTK